VADGFAGNRHASSTGSGGLAVGRNRKLERDMRTALTHAANMAGVIALRRIGLNTDNDRKARATQARMAGARYFGIGILQRRDYSGNAGGNDGVSAWWRLAMMRARFKRHKHCCAACRRAGAA